MTDYSELVKALRRCMNYGGDEDCRIECPYVDLSCGSCAHEQMLYDAAAAIEALEKALAEENEAEDDMYRLACEKQSKIEALQAEVNRLEPKRGEWLTTKYHTWECSVCGKNPTTGMGYVQTRKALYNYCPNCGAKMEVQE